MKNEKQKISISPINTKTIDVWVGGETMLQNRQTDKVKETMRGYQTGNRKPQDKTKQTPKEMLKDKTHFTSDGKVGFPATGFKKGLVEVAGNFGLYKKDIRGNVFVLGNIIPLQYKKTTTNVAWGKIMGKRPIEITRPEYQNWKCKLTIKYNSDALSAEQIVNLLNWAGFSQGIGDWRPACGGSYGQYQVLPTRK